MSVTGRGHDGRAASAVARLARSVRGRSVARVRSSRAARIDAVFAGIRVGSVAACALLLLFAVREIVSGQISLAAGLDALGAQSKALTTAGPRPDAVKPSGPVKDYSPIVERNVFGAVGAPVATPTPPPQKVVSKIPLELVGTFVSSKESPSAIIEDKRKGVQEVFYISDDVFGEAKLVAVRRDSVEIDRAGEREILVLDGGDASGGDAVPGGGEEIVVEERELDEALGNLPLLLTQVRAVPYFKEGQPVGLRLFAIKSGSLFEKIGLRNGDILMSINGNNLGDFSQAVKLFERLKSERTLAVSLERNREPKNFKYQIR